MARKRRKVDRVNPGVRVVDDGYIMGTLSFGFLNSVSVTNKWGFDYRRPWGKIPDSLPRDERRQIRVEVWQPGGVKEVRGWFSDDERRKALEGRTSYVVFPDFRIRESKLLPILEKLTKNGIEEIEYSHLKKILRM